MSGVDGGWVENGLNEARLIEPGKERDGWSEFGFAELLIPDMLLMSVELFLSFACVFDEMRPPLVDAEWCGGVSFGLSFVKGGGKDGGGIRIDPGNAGLCGMVNGENWESILV